MQLTYFKYDWGRFAQVLCNLLQNAIQYSHDYQTVAIEARVTDEQIKEATVEVTVKDNGVGISREQQNQIFNRFY